MNVGAIRNGSFSHEHYPSSPSKTLRAAMGCSVQFAGNPSRNGTFRSQGPKRWCISRAEQYVGRPERSRKRFQGGPVTAAAHKRPRWCRSLSCDGRADRPKISMKPSKRSLGNARLRRSGPVGFLRRLQMQRLVAGLYAPARPGAAIRLRHKGADVRPNFEDAKGRAPPVGVKPQNRPRTQRGPEDNPAPNIGRNDPPP